jgi:predicted permease
MQAILAVTGPFFALVLCGYLAARQRVLPDSAIPGLNAFVLYFALPCMLFRFGAETPVLELLNPSLLSVWLVCALLMLFFTVAVTLGPRMNLKNASFGALVAAFPNTGFMGVPLLVALLGPAAAGPAICTILVDIFVTTSLAIGLAQGAEASGQGARAAVMKALKGAMVNPLPWAIALGATVGALDLTLPGPVAAVVKMMADAASPVALFTIGAVLWRAGLQAHSRTPVSLYLPVAALKLLLHPVLVFVAAGAARQLGAPLTGFQIVVITLVAALPSASNVSVLAERYSADNGRVARIIMASTVVAFATFSALTWLLGVNPAV